MSDEYGSQGFGKQGSLVNESACYRPTILVPQLTHQPTAARDAQTERELTYTHSNYPPLNDSASYHHLPSLPSHPDLRHSDPIRWLQRRRTRLGARRAEGPAAAERADRPVIGRRRS